MKKSVLIYVLIAILVIILASVALVALGNNNADETKKATVIAVTQIDKTETSDIVASESTEKTLNYLIEEEKLAHDVYVYMYDLYGAQIFKNISASETTHQQRILSLLLARNLEDPRLDTPGKFSNQQLQELYNAFIVQGEKGLVDSYKVGVAIEEKDIADLQEAINSTNDDDIKNTLEYLKMASEKHLEAFNRQL